LEEVLIQQEEILTAGGFAGFITQSENVSFENEKMLLSMVLKPLLCREIWDRKND
jgi:hypothetical protein